MSFCKRMLGIKQSTQNDFVHGELGRIDYQSLRYINIVKFWLKIIQLLSEIFLDNDFCHNYLHTPDTLNW